MCYPFGRVITAEGSAASCHVWCVVWLAGVGLSFRPFGDKKKSEPGTVYSFYTSYFSDGGCCVSCENTWNNDRTFRLHTHLACRAQSAVLYQSGSFPAASAQLSYNLKILTAAYVSTDRIFSAREYIQAYAQLPSRSDYGAVPPVYHPSFHHLLHESENKPKANCLTPPKQ